MPRKMSFFVVENRRPYRRHTNIIRCQTRNSQNIQRLYAAEQKICRFDYCNGVAHDGLLFVRARHVSASHIEVHDAGNSWTRTHSRGVGHVQGLQLGGLVYRLASRTLQGLRQVQVDQVRDANAAFRSRPDFVLLVKMFFQLVVSQRRKRASTAAVNSNNWSQNWQTFQSTATATSSLRLTDLLSNKMDRPITDGLNTDLHLDIGNVVSLEKVDTFCYLGGMLDADCRRRIWFSSNGQ